MNTVPIERRRPVQNRILRSLSTDAYRRLASDLEPTTFTRGQVLHRGDDDMPCVYFPASGLCGVVTIADHQSVDVAPVGCEGVTGVFKFADGSTASRVVVQVGPAEALALPLERFNEELDRGEELRDLVTRYYRSFVTEVVESVACHRLHSTEQRFCRRLLEISDRLGSDEFVLTHDLMASMLGIQRPAVSGMAITLKHLGAIAYTRGKLAILDRHAVETRACPCYRTAHTRIAHLLPPRN